MKRQLRGPPPKMIVMRLRSGCSMNSKPFGVWN